MTAEIAAAGIRRLVLAEASTDPAVAAEVRSLFRRGAVPERTVRERVRAILDEIRPDPAAGVRSANERFGGGLADGRLVLRRGDLEGHAAVHDGDLRSALETAIANVRTFAASQRPSTTRTETVPGVEIERRWQPVRRVGCYVPGGSAPYPSSLVMTVVPAQVAGVQEIIVASPARRDGTVDPVLLGAAGLLGVDALVVAGGAQAIAALAFGLEPDTPAPDTPETNGLDPVDLIVGPGNAWVTAAKLELAGEVGIDLPAGPSEGMVLADGTADPVRVAADLLTQAEHGPDSPAILVTTDRALLDAVEAEIPRQLARADRREILERSLAAHGRLVLAADLAAAVEFVNAYAPEHLSVDVGPLEATVARLRNAGSLFVGPWAPESAGDYATGANHVLPTGGLARSHGPLGVETFGRFTQVQRISREGLANLRSAITTLADAEGLQAHRDAVEVRFAQETRS